MAASSPSQRCSRADGVCRSACSNSLQMTDLQSRRPALAVEPSALLQVKGVKSAPPFQAAAREGTPCRSLSQPRSPIAARQSTGWEISVAMGFRYKRPKDVDVNQVPRYPGRIFSALNPKLMWKLSSKTQCFGFSHETNVKCYLEIIFIF